VRDELRAAAQALENSFVFAYTSSAQKKRNGAEAPVDWLQRMASFLGKIDPRIR
jgi:hypothetical protein